MIEQPQKPVAAAQVNVRHVPKYMLPGVEGAGEGEHDGCRTLKEDYTRMHAFVGTRGV